jgi:chromosomal replication initiator protein
MSIKRTSCPSIDRIKALVAAEFRTTVPHLSGPQRYRRLVRARQVAMWLARRTTEHSLPQIGWAFDRDHTTVLHGIEKVDEIMERDPSFAEIVWLLHLAVLEPKRGDAGRRAAA